MISHTIIQSVSRLPLGIVTSMLRWSAPHVHPMRLPSERAISRMYGGNFPTMARSSISSLPERMSLAPVSTAQLSVACIFVLRNQCSRSPASQALNSASGTSLVRIFLHKTYQKSDCKRHQSAPFVSGIIGTYISTGGNLAPAALAAKLDAFSLKGILTDIRELPSMLRNPRHCPETRILLVCQRPGRPTSLHATSSRRTGYGTLCRAPIQVVVSLNRVLCCLIDQWR